MKYIFLTVFIVIGGVLLFFTAVPNNKLTKLKKMTRENQYKEIYFAGGCFWGTEHFFKQVKGVVSTKVGYANGLVDNPTYQMVTTGTTGFAETVKVVYNPEVVSLAFLIDLFFKTIDPTSLNQQGNDIGTQYRTGIYYVEKEDEAIIKTKLQSFAKFYPKSIVVEAIVLENFYDAENYHQDYLDKNPSGYCHINPSLFEYAKKAVDSSKVNN
ncbi:peptide-methionine (S)-S-oxide reductase MsrA [Flavobacterium sp. xlx-214]|uniref:peptide-methionine (S)-S-oxide reductase MsrA n=1 Tax=unclassified Flavobacterium TaxID=196869 RepID=UPI0013D3F1FB|nr:peptide-methionine (S)-S-oxide reductase MsrA [Flavobacterium sp. xlx-221]QMI82487.1 peptide-methionine (S)-S-oxide reductase MsrA [Flavobacterium sp. xlx-214]